MHSTDRVKFTAYLSVEEDKFQQASRLFGDALSRKFGGATIATADGYWAEDGADWKTTYVGSVLCERVLVINLSVDVEREAEALALLRSLGTRAVDELGMAATEMHIEVTSTRALHTNLRDAIRNST